MRATLPNAITASRIAAALGLLALVPFSAPWFALYVWCGASDVADGALARRWHLDSAMGARLDGIADAVLAATIAFELLPLVMGQAWLVAWMGGITLVRLASLAVCHRRFGVSSFLHTTANKATGIVSFVAVALVPWCGIAAAAVLPCAMASLSAAEELALMATSDALDLDEKGMFRR